MLEKAAQLIERHLRRLSPKYRIFKELFFDQHSYLKTTGWLESYHHKKPIDKNHKPIPWMNYAVIDLLDHRLQKDLSIFEYGSGFSTLFLAQRTSSVISLEYDEAWFKEVKSSLPSNASLLFQKADSDNKYCRAIILQNKLFDVIIIDGRDRVNCFKQGLSCLSDDGIIILDDSHREKYSHTFDIARNNDFKALTLKGLKPTESKIGTTTLFYRNNNCLGI